MFTCKISIFAFTSILLIQNVFPQPLSTDNNCGEDFNFETTTIQELIKIAMPKSEDPHFAAIVGCIWKKKGMVTDDGHVLVDNLRRAMAKEFRSKLPREAAEEKALEILDYCQDIRGKDSGETSLNMIKCFGRWETKSFIDNERRESYYAN